MLTIKTFPLGPLQTNCYLIHDTTSALVIDPGGAPAPVLEYLKHKKLHLERILCTHLHFDHTYGAAALAQETGAPLYASPEDNYMKSSELGQGGVWGLPSVPGYQSMPIQPGAFPILGTECKVLATPGHSPGGLSFYFEQAHAVFSGDTLFSLSIGRTDLEGGNLAQLEASIKKELFVLPSETKVYPGHGDPSTIGKERTNNPYVGDFAR